MESFVTGRLYFSFGKEGTSTYTKNKSIGVGPLEVVRLAAYSSGFRDVDAEPTENGWKITVAAQGRSLTGRGKTQTEACASLLEKLEQ